MKKQLDSQETKIEKVVLTVAGQTVSVTLEQALQLRDALNQAFPKDVFVPVYIHTPPPIVLERPYTPYQPPFYPIITCGTTQLPYEIPIGTAT